MPRRPAALIAASALVVTLSTTGAALPSPTDGLDGLAAPGTERGAERDAPTAAERRAELDAATQALVDDGAVAVVGRVETPDVDWRGAAGTRTLHGEAPARPRDRFRVGSITKTMVATVVLQEVEAGRLSLDTPVNEIVKDLFPGHPDITVEQLLSHRSGATTGTDALLLAHMDDPTSWHQFIAAISQDYTAEEHLAAVNATPWLFAPGTDFGYSNAGYIALGAVLEELTGEGLEDLLQDRVFDEAGMYQTSFPDEPAARGPLLVESMWTGEAEAGGIGWVSLDGFDPDVFGAAGAVVSTTADLNRFTEALVDGELLDSETVEDMLVPRTPEPLEYGLGIFRIPDLCTDPGEPPAWLYGHTGGTYGTTSVALTSADGYRQLSLGVTGRDLTGAQPFYDVNQLIEPMMLASCGD
jgi:D-alanyl-D-alanine carboxypeptidase